MPASIDEIHPTNLTRAAYDKEGVTLAKLINKHKLELEALETKTIKVKGAVPAKKLPKGFRIIATSGQIVTTKDGEEYGDGETIVQWDEVNWAIRQKGRMDANELRGDYPAKKQEHSGTIRVLHPCPVNKPPGAGLGEDRAPG